MTVVQSQNPVISLTENLVQRTATSCSPSPVSRESEEMGLSCVKDLGYLCQNFWQRRLLNIRTGLEKEVGEFPSAEILQAYVCLCDYYIHCLLPALCLVSLSVVLGTKWTYLKDEGGGGWAAEKGRGCLINQSLTFWVRAHERQQSWAGKPTWAGWDAKMVRFKTWMDMEDTGWPWRRQTHRRISWFSLQGRWEITLLPDFDSPKEYEF